MEGVVSLLDDEHYRIVENLWAELEREFSVRGVYITPYPHFSYQVSAHYSLEQLTPILQEFAAHSQPFRVQTSGLGIFNGPRPVLYIPVARSPQLTQFHQALCDIISPAGSSIQNYYHPDVWMPHITIGFGDLNADILSKIVNYLNERDFAWDITIDNIALIYDTGTKQELHSRFTFKSE